MNMDASNSPPVTYDPSFAPGDDIVQDKREKASWTVKNSLLFLIGSAFQMNQATFPQLRKLIITQKIPGEFIPENSELAALDCMCVPCCGLN